MVAMLTRMVEFSPDEFTVPYSIQHWDFHLVCPVPMLTMLASGAVFLVMTTLISY